MERFYRHVGSAKISLEETPEIFERISVNPSIDVPLRMVNPFVNVAPVQLVIHHRIVGVYLAAVLHVLENQILQGIAPNIRDDVATDFASLAVKHSHDGSLTQLDVATALLTAYLLQLRLALAVHVLSESADKGFVCLYFLTGTADLRSSAESP